MDRPGYRWFVNPEPQIATATLLGLWRVQFRAPPDPRAPRPPLPDAIEVVRREVSRAARPAEARLTTFPAPANGIG